MSFFYLIKKVYQVFNIKLLYFILSHNLKLRNSYFLLYDNKLKFYFTINFYAYYLIFIVVQIKSTVAFQNYKIIINVYIIKLKKMLP